MRFAALALLSAAVLAAPEQPEVFAEGVISTPGTTGITFSADGGTAYFGRYQAAEKRWTILTSRLGQGGWSAAEAAPFSGKYNDGGPALSPDGSKLFFWSLRPRAGAVPGEGKLWMTERSGQGWSEPRDLGAPVNGPDRPSANPAVTADGTLYFITKGADAVGDDDIYLARPVNGRYEKIENAGTAINSAQHEFDVSVAPDESWLLFSSDRPGGHGKTDLYLSVGEKGAWTPARNLGVDVNTEAAEMGPAVSPDGRHLYFTRMGGGKPGIYRIDAGAAGIAPRPRTGN